MSTIANRVRLQVEALEERQVLSGLAGPVIKGAVFLGKTQRITGAILVIDEGGLDVSRAQDLANYTLAGTRRGTFQSIPLKPIAKDDVFNGGNAFATITLRPSQPFALTSFQALRITVNGSTPTGVTDQEGRLLDGNQDGTPGGDAILQFNVLHGRQVQFTDPNGSRLRLRVSGNGSLDGLVLLGTAQKQVWVTGIGNVVTGSVFPAPGTDGSTTILRLVPGNNLLRAKPTIEIGETVSPGKVDSAVAALMAFGLV
jgi:hypothetical protein